MKRTAGGRVGLLGVAALVYKSQGPCHDSNLMLRKIQVTAVCKGGRLLVSLIRIRSGHHGFLLFPIPLFN